VDHIHPAIREEWPCKPVNEVQTLWHHRGGHGHPCAQVGARHWTSQGEYHYLEYGNYFNEWRNALKM
jgi:hypothetical protein